LWGSDLIDIGVIPCENKEKADCFMRFPTHPLLAPGIAVCLFLSFLCTPAKADTFGKDARDLFLDAAKVPVTFLKELVVTLQGIMVLGTIRRAEDLYFVEYGRYVSEGLGEWGAPFTTLTIQPNASPRRGWDYRVQAQSNTFVVVARRRTGPHRGTDIRIDHEGVWSGDYPFWPVHNFPFRK